jgi:hypothetical protein
MKFKDECPLATPEATEQKLLEIVNAIEADHAGRLSVAIINRQFRDAARQQGPCAVPAAPLVFCRVDAAVTQGSPLVRFGVGGCPTATTVETES